jgi:CheY-like chemotaxis protein
LIDEILDLAKVESGQVSLSPEPVSLAEIIIECQSMVEPQAQQRGLKMIYPKCETPYFVRADRTRLKQILINLLSNAVKYNSEKGTVEVTCSEITAGRIRLSVRDTGLGMSHDQIGQLFQTFNRLGQEGGNIEGTGIGLVVAKRLVELMGGVIGVDSVLGVGSVFWFELISVAGPHIPIETEIDTSTRPRMRRAKGKYTLLYVEDNPANLKLVEQIIKRYPDLQLLTACDGKSGIEIAVISKPDVVLMDINLPDMNGFTALKILTSNPVTSLIPVIAISANAMPRDIQKGLEAGFYRYITKPIIVTELMEALDVTLESKGN